MLVLGLLGLNVGLGVDFDSMLGPGFLTVGPIAEDLIPENCFTGPQFSSFQLSCCWTKLFPYVALSQSF